MQPHGANHRALIVGLLLVTGVSTSVPAQQRDVAVDGVWRLADEVDRRAVGSVIRTGPAAGYNGLLIITSSG